MLNEIVGVQMRMLYFCKWIFIPEYLIWKCNSSLTITLVFVEFSFRLRTVIFQSRVFRLVNDCIHTSPYLVPGVWTGKYQENCSSRLPCLSLSMTKEQDKSCMSLKATKKKNQQSIFIPTVYVPRLTSKCFIWLRSPICTCKCVVCALTHILCCCDVKTYQNKQTDKQTTNKQVSIQAFNIPPERPLSKLGMIFQTSKSIWIILLRFNTHACCKPSWHKRRSVFSKVTKRISELPKPYTKCQNVMTI